MSERDVRDLPAFKAWFGQSKIVGPDGRPLMVFHGGQKLTAWNDPGDESEIYGGHAEAIRKWYGSAYNSVVGENGHKALQKPVHFFTDDEGVAEGYGDQGDHYEVRCHYLCAVNPLDLRYDIVGRESVETALKKILGEDYEMPFGYGMHRQISQSLRWNWTDVREEVEAMGHDGVILYDTDVRDRGQHTSYAVFRPEQIKSATHNRGTFDPQNPDIRMSLRGRERGA